MIRADLRQFDLFAEPTPRSKFDRAKLTTPRRPYQQGDVCRLWHSLHPYSGRAARYFWDAVNTVWTCIDPFDTTDIIYRDEPPIVNVHGRHMQ